MHQTVPNHLPATIKLQKKKKSNNQVNRTPIKMNKLFGIQTAAQNRELQVAR